jgi:gamma-glutamyltranspeptidase / glutathione hydrolase
MKGAVAAGSPLTVEAGLWALNAGGNAIDAAVAASLMAGVAEPLLTGLGGAGMATVRSGGRVSTVDFFSNMPGLGPATANTVEMDEVRIDFGPTTQSFLVGPGAASPPGVPSGLWALNKAHGSMPMADLVMPAVKAAREGVEVTAGFARVCALLWPILARSAALRAIFAPNGEPIGQGETFVCPNLANTLEDYAQDPACFGSGNGAKVLLDQLSTETRISAEDLAQQATCIRPAIAVHYRGAKLWVPGAPSAAGLGVAHTLATLELEGAPVAPTGIETVQRMARAIGATVEVRGKPFLRDLFTDGFSDSFVARVQAMRSTTDHIAPGYTTHISTVDASGNAVSITHSLGETAGVTLGESGVIINNFLGESDVNPPFLQRPAGARLITMCCPSILELPDGRIIPLGAGGSSRIPTAVVHGAMYIVDHHWSVADAVNGPRTHVEGGLLHVESEGRSAATMAAVGEANPDHVRFDGPNMFFGGLHAASVGPDGFAGEGDARRSGAFGIV